MHVPHRAGLIAALWVSVAMASTAFGHDTVDAAESEALTFLPGIAEAARLVERHGEAVWPGWGELAPVLVREGPHEYLIGHPSALPPFAPVGEGGVQRLDGYLTPAPVATTWPVGGVWCVAIPAPRELQAIVDAALGPEVVVIDAPTYVRVLVHEAFHAHQLTALGGVAGIPRFGLDGTQATERGATETLMALPDLDRRHAAQGTALVAALHAPDGAQAARAALDFLGLRDRHRRSLSDEVAAFERSVEWLEGAARYADTRLLSIGARDPARSDAMVDGAAETVWRDFSAQLQDPDGHGVGLRDRYAALGAAQGMVLDRLHPGWQDRVLYGGEAIEDVLREAVGRSPDGGS